MPPGNATVNCYFCLHRFLSPPDHPTMACVTLISDFGHQDASVAKVKGILMCRLPALPVLDITHQIPPYHLQQAAYVLLASYLHFPEGSYHLPLVEVFREQPVHMLVAKHEGHFFVVPDNGLLALAFGESLTNVWQVPRKEPVGAMRDWVQLAATVIHLLQQETPEQLGYQPCAIRQAGRHWLPKYDAERQCLECHVMHMDNFGNVVLNLHKDAFETYSNGRPFYIQLLRDEVVSHISAHYHQVAAGQKLCRFNEAGFLEIAINKGSAAKLFGLKVYSEQQLMYNHIRICFGEAPPQRVLRLQLEAFNQL